MSITIPTVAREVHLVAGPVGEPTKAEFALVDAPVVPPAADQVLVRSDWFSVDPYMRSRMNDVKSYVPPFALGAPMGGGAVGTVVESSATSVPVGASVLHNLGWALASSRARERRSASALGEPLRRPEQREDHPAVSHHRATSAALTTGAADR